MTRILSITALATALFVSAIATSAQAAPSGLYAGSGAGGVWSGQAYWVQDAFKPKR